MGRLGGQDEPALVMGLSPPSRDQTTQRASRVSALRGANSKPSGDRSLADVGGRAVRSSAEAIEPRGSHLPRQPAHLLMARSVFTTAGEDFFSPPLPALRMLAT